MMYTYIYYFILNEEQRKKYIIENITDPGKHIRANIGEGVKPYDVFISKNLDDNHILYRTDFHSDIYIPNLRNAQITKTFYSLQKDLYGNECREDIELNKDFEIMNRKLCEIKLKEDKDKNKLIYNYVRGKTLNMPSKDNKFYYSYTYFFTLFNNDVNNYILHDSSGDYICTYRLDSLNIGNYYVQKINDNNIRTCYAVAFESKTKNTACERNEMIYKTLFSNVGSIPKENVRFLPSLEKLYEYCGVNNKKEIKPMNNYAYVSAGCMTNEHVGLEIKEVKYNGPATIVFWNDGTKTIAKCQEDMSNYKAEKGLAMAISKKVIKSEYYAIKDIKIGHNDNSIIVYWEHGTEAEIKFDNHVCDFEYCIALARVKKFFGSKTRNNTKWYEKFKSYIPKEEKKPLVIDSGKPNHCDKNTTKKSDTTCEDFMPKPNTHIETDQEFVLRLFNEGYSLKKISDKTGVTMYHVRRYIDEATKPDKFKNKETKRYSNKRTRTYHKLTDLEDPSWLLPEECKDIREAVKEKFKDKHMTMSLLQKEYIRECRKYKLKQCYGNGYSMYELAKIIGDTNAAGLMRIWNDMNKEGD